MNVSEPHENYMKNPLTKEGIRIYKSCEEAEKGEYLISGQKSAIED